MNLFRSLLLPILCLFNISIQAVFYNLEYQKCDGKPDVLLLSDFHCDYLDLQLTMQDKEGLYYIVDQYTKAGKEVVFLIEDALSPVGQNEDVAELKEALVREQKEALANNKSIGQRIWISQDGKEECIVNNSSMWGLIEEFTNKGIQSFSIENRSDYISFSDWHSVLKPVYAFKDVVDNYDDQVPFKKYFQQLLGRFLSRDEDCLAWQLLNSGKPLDEEELVAMKRGYTIWDFSQHEDLVLHLKSSGETYTDTFQNYLLKQLFERDTDSSSIGLAKKLSYLKVDVFVEFCILDKIYREKSNNTLLVVLAGGNHIKNVSTALHAMGYHRYRYVISQEDVSLELKDFKINSINIRGFVDEDLKLAIT